MPFAVDDDAGRRKHLKDHYKDYLPTTLGKTPEINWQPFVVNRAFAVREQTGFDVDHADIVSRVKEDVTRIKAFIDAEIGATPADAATGAFATRTPPMLDLRDACKTRPAIQAIDLAKRVTLATTERRKRIIRSALRSLAINVDFWETDRSIRAPALREYIDRRVRIVEMVLYHVNTIDTQPRVWNISKPSPAEEVWQDAHRNRLFEYPVIGQAENVVQFVDRARAAGVLRVKVGDAGKLYETQPALDALKWDWIQVNDAKGLPFSLTWDHKPPFPQDPELPLSPADAAVTPPTEVVEVNLRLPSEQERRQWRLSRRDFYTVMFYNMPNGLTFVQALDRMFKLRDAGSDTRLDFYKRTWFNCDHVLSALQCEALLLAWRRRVLPQAVAHAEEVLNLLAQNPPADPGSRETRYAWFGPMVQETSGMSTGLLDGRSGNPMFRTRQVEVDKLEIGDHVIYWNNGMYDLVDSGLWRLENAVITDLTESEDGTVNPASVRLAGHGLGGSLADYARYFTTTMQTLVRNTLIDIANKLVNPGPATAKRRELLQCDVIKWSPYPELRAPTSGDVRIGPWWIVYPLTRELTRGHRDPLATTVRRAVLELPGSVGIEEQPNSQYRILMGSRSGPLATMQLVEMTAASDFRPFTADHPTLNLFQYVLLPLTQPKFARKPNEMASPTWARYFGSRTAPTTTTRLIEPLQFDSTLLPGLTSVAGKVWSNGPRVRLVLP